MERTAASVVGGKVAVGGKVEIITEWHNEHKVWIEDVGQMVAHTFEVGQIHEVTHVSQNGRYVTVKTTINGVEFTLYNDRVRKVK